MAVAFKTKPGKPVYSREVEESKSRYVLFIGDTEDGKLYTPPSEFNIGIPYLERGVLTEIVNHSFYDRDQEDRNNPMFPRHADKTRQHEIRLTVRAAHIADWLERRYGNQGLVYLECCTDKDQALIAQTITLLLPLSEEEQATITLDALRELIDKKIDEGKFPDKKFAIQVHEAIIAGIDKMETFALNVLANMKAEMEQRRTANGVGISKLDARARRLIKLLNKSAAEYEVDGQSLQQALISQFTNNKPQGMDISVLAGTIGAVLQQLGIVPAQAAVTPTPEVVAKSEPAKPAAKGK